MQAIIELLTNDLYNEYHHMHFYLWASSVVTGLHREELSEFFYEAAQSEMNHVKEFNHMLLGLNTTVPFAAVKIAPLNTDAKSLLEYAVKIENEVVVNYTQRIEDAVQLGGTDGKFLEIFLENQLLDSRNDAIHMEQMLQGLTV